MVINDLKQPCGPCGGSGKQPGFNSLGVSQINYVGGCHTCSGRGFVLTELGKDLLDFLKPFVLEWITKEKSH